ncbi:hypothetical protein ABZ725_43045 [Streptomyces sp. NPDC006872]|uniref:hypothetical protein n=1 Tax=Streptomyces sp. NPDC006872 TaxID=3155720 RepID=UPI0033ED969B
MVIEYVLRIPLERHVLSTRRPFTAVIEDIRDAIGGAGAGGELQGLPSSAGWRPSGRQVNGRPVPAGLIGIGELDIDRALVRGAETARLLRLLVDMPAASRDLVRFLPDAGASCPVAILVQQAADGGTRLLYDSVVSALSVYQDEASLAVARGLDAEVLALLRRVTAGDG